MTDMRLSGPFTNRSRGRMIVLEGLEGAGKTTQMAAIAGYLRSAGIDVLETREPGGTTLGERIRDLLLATPRPLNPSRSSDWRDERDPETMAAMHADTELLLMFAARAEHWHRVIAPALDRGSWVVSDRFVDASYAYQGGGRELGAERVAALETWLLGEMRPDLVLWFDVPPEVGLARVRQRAITAIDGNASPDRFEREAVAFFERARAAYARRAAAAPERYRRIDAAASIDDMRAAVQAVIAREIEPMIESGNEYEIKLKIEDRQSPDDSPRCA
ncbi:MAG: dTMP kinase [Thioalkalivibrionaceae bacterium]